LEHPPRPEIDWRLLLREPPQREIGGWAPIPADDERFAWVVGREPLSVRERELVAAGEVIADARKVPSSVPQMEWQRDDPEPPTGPHPATDELAWYRSFRHGPGLWGVVITRRGLERVARALVRASMPPRRARAVAWHFLCNHETFHFLADRAVLVLEMVRSGLDPSLQAGGEHALWTAHHTASAPYSQLGEACANAFALSCADRGDRDLLFSAVVARQPPGYRDAVPHADEVRVFGVGFATGVRWLLSDHLRASVLPVSASRLDELHGGPDVLGLDALLMIDRHAPRRVRTMMQFPSGHRERLPVRLVN
jgi:hypothetical protein